MTLRPVMPEDMPIATPIHVDIQALQRPETANRGIGRYVVAMVESMLDAHLPIVGLGLNPSLPMPDLLPDSLVGSDLLCWSTRTELRRRVGGSGFIHLVASPFGVPDVATSGVFPAWLDDDGVVTATVVYDLIPFLYPEHYAVDEASRRFLAERRDHVIESDLLLAISERTRADIIEHWQVDPTKVIAIGAPRPAGFGPTLTDDSGDTRGARIVLAPVGYEWRKEPSVLLEGWSRVPRRTRRGRRLVLVGEAPDDVRSEWAGMARKLGLKRGEVEMLGRVDDQTLRRLYGAAELVVHGSRYEGYGLPVIEAAMCGAASITSNGGAISEILNCRESVFDAESADSIAATIVRALADGCDRGLIVAAAARAAAIDDKFGSQMTTALVSAGEPDSWTPPTSVLLIGGSSELAGSLELEGIVVTHLTGDRVGAPDMSLAAAHDHLVHVISDNHHDTAVLRWVMSAPGVVMCHRADLSMLWIQQARADTTSDEEAVDRLHEVLRRSYRGAHPPVLPSGDLLDPTTWAACGVKGFGALIAANPVTAVLPDHLDAVRFDAGPLLQGRVVELDNAAPGSLLGLDI